MFLTVSKNICFSKHYLQPAWDRRSPGKERYYLNENCKEYHHDNSSDEQFLPGKHSRRKQKYKWKTNCSSETSIGNNKLVLKSERYCPEYINDLSQNKNTWGEKTEIQRGGGEKELKLHRTSPWCYYLFKNTYIYFLPFICFFNIY